MDMNWTLLGGKGGKKSTNTHVHVPSKRKSFVLMTGGALLWSRCAVTCAWGGS
jgi:hypothetical protein